MEWKKRKTKEKDEGKKYGRELRKQGGMENEMEKRIFR